MINQPSSLDHSCPHSPPHILEQWSLILMIDPQLNINHRARVLNHLHTQRIIVDPDDFPQWLHKRSNVDQPLLISGGVEQLITTSRSTSLSRPHFRRLPRRSCLVHCAGPVCDGHTEGAIKESDIAFRESGGGWLVNGEQPDDWWTT